MVKVKSLNNWQPIKASALEVVYKKFGIKPAEMYPKDLSIFLEKDVPNWVRAFHYRKSSKFGNNLKVRV